MPEEYKGKKEQEAEDSERDARSKRFTRREALKYGGKIGVGAAVYGAVGGALGKLYEVLTGNTRKAIKYTGNKLAEVDEKVEKSKNPAVKKVVKPVKRVEDWRGRTWRKVFGRTDEDTADFREEYEIETAQDRENKKNPEYVKKRQERRQRQEEERMSRRGFFERVFNYFHKNPIKIGAGVGAAYGAGKTAIKGAGTYRTNKKIARLKDDVEDLKQELRKKGKGLEATVEAKVVDENKTSKAFLTLGIIGIIVSIILSSIHLTGFSVLETGSFNAFSTSVVVFFASLIAVVLSRLF